MKLYVGNIPYGASEEDVRELFAEFEPLSDFYFPMDRDTGRPRGFAFVTLGSKEQGEEVIRRLDGHEVDGRALRVSEARERERSGGGGGFQRGGGRRDGGGGGDRGDRRGPGGPRRSFR